MKSIDRAEVLQSPRSSCSTVWNLKPPTSSGSKWRASTKFRSRPATLSKRVSLICTFRCYDGKEFLPRDTQWRRVEMHRGCRCTTKMSSHVFFQQLENCACGSACVYLPQWKRHLQPLDAFSELLMHPKCISGPGSATNPAGGAYSAPHTP